MFEPPKLHGNHEFEDYALACVGFTLYVQGATSGVHPELPAVTSDGGGNAAVDVGNRVLEVIRRGWTGDSGRGCTCGANYSGVASGSPVQGGNGGVSSVSTGLGGGCGPDGEGSAGAGCTREQHGEGLRNLLSDVVESCAGGPETGVVEPGNGGSDVEVSEKTMRNRVKRARAKERKLRKKWGLGGEQYEVDCGVTGSAVPVAKNVPAGLGGSYGNSEEGRIEILDNGEVQFYPPVEKVCEEKIETFVSKSRKKRERRKQSRVGKAVEESGEIPEWRRGAGPENVGKVSGAKSGVRPSNASARWLREDGFFSQCPDELKQELVASRAQRFIAENKLIAAQNAAKIGGANRGPTKLAHEMLGVLRTAVQLKKAADGTKFQGWAETVADSMATATISSAAASEPDSIPSLDSVKLGETSTKSSSGDPSASGKGPEHDKRVAEYYTKKAEMDEYYDNVDAYYPSAKEFDAKKLRDEYLDVVGTEAERVEKAAYVRMKELLEYTPDLPDGVAEKLLSRFDVLDEYDPGW